MSKRVQVRGWCRADLAGGTLDIWPIGILHPGARTVNLAIDLAVEVELAQSPSKYRVHQGDSAIETTSLEELAASSEGALIGQIGLALSLPPFEARIRSDSPRGGGLGASSALAVAAIAAGQELTGHGPSSPEARSALARDIEARLMQLPTGRQDHYPALIGGALEIRHEPGGERVRSLDVDLEALGDCLIIAYTGQSHFSAGNNWEVVRRRLDQDPAIISVFDRIRDVSSAVVGALEQGDLRRLGELVAVEWSLRRQLSNHKSTPMIESILERAVVAGAWGGKATGAGGGGCVLILCPTESRSRIVTEVEKLGAEILPTRPATGPLEVVVG